MFPRIKLNIKAMCVTMNLARLTSGSIFYRVRVMRKYYNFYIYHTNQQQIQIKQNLQYFSKVQQQSFSSYQSRINQLYKKYSQKIRQQVKSKSKSLQQKQRSQYEKQAQNLLHSAMAKLSLYYESLQNMIEGRRQVLHDQKFRFQDGQTVEQKRIRFQKYLSRLLGRKKQEIDRLEQQNERKKYSQQQKANI